MSLLRMLVLLTLALAGAVCAAPSFLGPTGLLLVPTADALAADEMALSVYGTEGGVRAAYVFNYGIRQNLEVGFARYADRETVINAKYNFQPEDGRRAGVAMGVLDLTDQVNASLYIVASKKFELSSPGFTNFRVHAGLASGGAKNSTVPLDGFFGGLSLDISEKVILMAEHDGNNVNVGGGVLFGRGLQANVGMVGDDETLVYGASYTTSF
ncbi:MAG TPA: hypothetical protein PLZ36_08470 [Armatimonadota bacterium]|nr:hypothetical protein [Armatimonadota bacterium]